MICSPFVSKGLETYHTTWDLQNSSCAIRRKAPEKAVGYGNANIPASIQA